MIPLALCVYFEHVLISNEHVVWILLLLFSFSKTSDLLPCQEMILPFMLLLYLSLYQVYPPPWVEHSWFDVWYVGCGSQSCCSGQEWTRCQTPCPPPAGVWAVRRAESLVSSTLIMNNKRMHSGGEDQLCISKSSKHRMLGIETNKLPWQLIACFRPEDAIVIDRDDMVH